MRLRHGRGSDPQWAALHCVFLADVAQLVERNLAKVEVAGSIPVVRSKTPVYQGF